METLGVIQYDSALPLSGISFVGDLNWVQRRMIKYNQRDHRYNETKFNDFEIADLLRDYTDRDCTFKPNVFIRLIIFQNCLYF